MVKRTILSGLGVTIGTAAMMLSSSAHADEVHCSDRSLKAAALAKVGSTAKQITDPLTISPVTLDESRAVTADAKANAQTVVISTPTAAANLTVNVAAEADVGVLVCVYMRGTEYGAGLEGWRKVTNANELHSAYGSPLAGNKVNESFNVEAKREASYGYGLRADSSWDASHVVAIVLTPAKGDAKVTIGLNKPATAATAPPPVAQDGLIGVDRGMFFSNAANKQMEFWNVHKEVDKAPNQTSVVVSRSNHKCLAAVKQTLADTNSLISDDHDTTRLAKNFADVMRDKTKVQFYRELKPSEVTFANAAPDEKTRWNYHRIAQLRDRLPVGSIIVYESHDPTNLGIDPEIGHIDMVADFHGQKALMSDHVGTSYANGWKFLENKKKNFNLTISIFVPTEKNNILRAKTLDFTDHSKDPKPTTPPKAGGPGPRPQTGGPGPRLGRPTPGARLTPRS